MAALKKYLPALVVLTALSGCGTYSLPGLGKEVPVHPTNTNVDTSTTAYRLSSTHWQDVAKIRDEAVRLNDQVGQGKMTKVQAAQYLNRFRIAQVGHNPVDDSVYDVYLKSAVDSQRGAITSAQSRQFVKDALDGWRQRWPNMRQKPSNPAFTNFLMEVMGNKPLQ